MKYLILMALCALQLTIVSVAEARSLDNAEVTDDRSPWYCRVAVAGSEQEQDEAGESNQEAEEEPDCD